MKLAFMGTPGFAVPALQALANAGHDIVAVYSQPPKPAGRGHHLQKSPVQLAAEAMNIDVRTPKTLRDATAQSEFAALGLDLAVIVAYGLILPQAVLDAPRLGCLNIHGSLLPRWRGAAPLQRAMLAGDSETGITIMQMDVGLDTGAMLLVDRLPITDMTTAGGLHDDMAAMGARLIVEAVEKLQVGMLPATAQPTDGVTYAAKLTREDGRVDWTRPAMEIERQIRSLQPWPGTFFMYGDEVVKLLKAEIATGSDAPGTILADDCVIACGTGALRLQSVQRPDKGPVSGGDFLRGQRLTTGQSL